VLKVLEENINSLVEICIENEQNKHLQSQCLNGLYHLLTFDKLIEKATCLKQEETKSNYYALAKCLWHSLWINSIESLDER